MFPNVLCSGAAHTHGILAGVFKITIKLWTSNSGSTKQKSNKSNVVKYSDFPLQTVVLRKAVNQSVLSIPCQTSQF